MHLIDDVKLVKQPDWLWLILALLRPKDNNKYSFLGSSPITYQYLPSCKIIKSFYTYTKKQEKIIGFMLQSGHFKSTITQCKYVNGRSLDSLNATHNTASFSNAILVKDQRRLHILNFFRNLRKLFVKNFAIQNLTLMDLRPGPII